MSFKLPNNEPLRAIRLRRQALELTHKFKDLIFPSAYQVVTIVLHRADTTSYPLWLVPDDRHPRLWIDRPLETFE